MAAEVITWDDKEIYEDHPEIPDNQKLRFDDANALKYVANNHAGLLDILETDKLSIVNDPVALVDAASMQLTAAKHTLSTSSATRTFTITYTGDNITIEVTLNATSSTFTFPLTTLCISEGVASGDHNMSLSGVSGDRYIIEVKKIGSNYYAAVKNFKQ